MITQGDKRPARWTSNGRVTSERLAQNGVTIREEIERRTGRSVSIGSLYKALHRLERQGLTGVTVGEPTGVRGGRAKKYVHLRPAGRSALGESVEALLRRTTLDLALDKTVSRTRARRHLAPESAGR
jgi:DNA-binding PadR family transcriptional regulator